MQIIGFIKKHYRPLLTLLFFLFTTVLYLKNMTRDIYSGDIGDLVTAGYVFGVAHPPGYPLFSLLGYIFSHLPLALPPVTKITMISVFASIGSLYFYYLSAQKITKSQFLSLLSTSILAFSYLFWIQAEIPEVFALNHLLASGILYGTLRFYYEKNIIFFYLVAFLVGLSLTHHHTILFLFPGILILLARHIKLLFSKWRYIPYGILLGLLGLSVYIYVPIAASTHPPISWDNAYNLSNFLHLILRKDYSGTEKVISEIPNMIRLLVTNNFLKAMITNFSYQVIFLMLLGGMYLLKKDRFLFVGLIVTWILSGPFFVFYAASLYTTSTSLGIIERFYSLSTVTLMLFVPFGLILLQQLITRFLNNKNLSYLLLSYFLIVPVLLLNYNNEKVDLSKTQIGNTLARNILSALPKNALLYVEGDTTSFNIWYVHYVLLERPDIVVINPPGVGGGSKFLDDQVNAYHKKYPKVPLNQVLVKTIEEIRKDRKIFATYEMEYQPADSLLLPRGLVYELIYRKDIPEETVYQDKTETILQKIKLVRRENLTPAEQNLIAAEIPLIYSNGLVRIGDYVAMQYKNPQLSEHYYRRALWIDDANPAAYAGLALSQYKSSKDCTNAISNLRSAITLYPVWETYYLQLYYLYEQCNIQGKQKQELQQTYQKTFNDSLEKQSKKTQQ